MLCFLCMDLIHATAEVWCFFEQYYWLKKCRFGSVRCAPCHNMEAIWAVGVVPGSSILIDQQKNSVWRAYFMCFHAEKEPGLNFRRNYTLKYSEVLFPGVFRVQTSLLVCCVCVNRGVGLNRATSVYV